VVKAYNSWMKGLWFKPSDPTVETIFHAPFTWINSMKQERDNGMFQPTWHCCMCCDPANGGGGLWERLACKFQVHKLGMNMKLPGPKSNKTKYVFKLIWQNYCCWNICAMMLVFYTDPNKPNLNLLLLNYWPHLKWSNLKLNDLI
jgi:hypothetical protein